MSDLERVFSVLRTSIGKSVPQIATEVGLAPGPTSSVLGGLKVKGVAATYGAGSKSRWLAVPGATLPKDMRGKSAGSRANLVLGPQRMKEAIAHLRAQERNQLEEAKRQAEQPVPDLSWASVLGG